MKCSLRGIVIVALAGLLLACGQKGPLVLPDAPKHKRGAPAQPAPAPAPAPPNTAAPDPSPQT
jgi:predicted small lipoprotein YifL